MTAGLEDWKFGGASLANARVIQRAAGRIAARNAPLVVVASALACVTDRLFRATPQAGDAFRRAHQQVARRECTAASFFNDICFLRTS